MNSFFYRTCNSCLTMHLIDNTISLKQWKKPWTDRILIEIIMINFFHGYTLTILLSWTLYFVLIVIKMTHKLQIVESSGAEGKSKGCLFRTKTNRIIDKSSTQLKSSEKNFFQLTRTPTNCSRTSMKTKQTRKLISKLLKR